MPRVDDLMALGCTSGRSAEYRRVTESQTESWGKRKKNRVGEKRTITMKHKQMNVC